MYEQTKEEKNTPPPPKKRCMLISELLYMSYQKTFSKCVSIIN